MADLFAVQDQIAISVAEALGVLLDREGRERMQRAGLRDIAAYVAYERGLQAYVTAHDNLISRLAEMMPHFDLVLARVPHHYPSHVYRSDLYFHQRQIWFSSLINPALEFGSYSADEIARADAAYRAALDSAAPHARNDAERRHIDAQRRYYSGDWRGLDDLTASLVTAPGCALILGAPDWTALSRHRVAVADFLERQLRCGAEHNLTVDYLWSLHWAGRPLDVIEEFNRLADPRIPGDLRFFAMLATDVAAVAPQIHALPASAISPRFTLHAVEGDAAAAREAVAVDPDYFDERRWITLLRYARIGDRDGANRVAAWLDSLHPELLVRAVQLCLCGAPFDLEATPNFAARVREAGFPWPPPSPVRFPAKDW